MKKLLTFLFIILGYLVTAQDCKTTAGTKTLYTPQQVVYTSAPAGYYPIFINHVGRHGARHLTKDVSTYFAYKLLMKADSLHALTTAGDEVKKMISALRIIEAPFIKSISERGKNELEGIAARMVKANISFFNNQPGINVKVTKEIRTSQSATAFLNKISQANGAIKINKTIDDTALRFYDLSPAYLKFEQEGKWKRSVAVLQATLNMKAIFQEFTDKCFNKDFVTSDGDKEEFCKDIYGFSTIVNSVSFETERFGKHAENINFRSLFSCTQLAALAKVDEAEDFLLKGPGADAMGIQVKIAVPLLVEFINSTDEYMNGGSASLQLRFAHAETLSPFAALMQIKSAFEKSWKADKIIPLSANIQWIFYQKKNSKDLLVKFLLNEKEVLINGLNPKTYPFYSWVDVRKFYWQLLRQLHVDLNDDMGAYLLQLK